MFWLYSLMVGASIMHRAVDVKKGLTAIKGSSEGVKST